MGCIELDSLSLSLKKTFFLSFQGSMSLKNRGIQCVDFWKLSIFKKIEATFNKDNKLGLTQFVLKSP